MYICMYVVTCTLQLKQNKKGRRTSFLAYNSDWCEKITLILYYPSLPGFRALKIRLRASSGCPKNASLHYFIFGSKLNKRGERRDCFGFSIHVLSDFGLAK